MKPARHNFYGQKAGSRFTEAFNLCDENGVAADLTGYSALLTIGVPGMKPVLRASSAAGEGVFLNGQPSNLVVDFDLNARAGDYQFDLVLVDVANRQWPVLTGDFELQENTQ